MKNGALHAINFGQKIVSLRTKSPDQIQQEIILNGLEVFNIQITGQMKVVENQLTITEPTLPEYYLLTSQLQTSRILSEILSFAVRDIGNRQAKIELPTQDLDDFFAASNVALVAGQNVLATQLNRFENTEINDQRTKQLINLLIDAYRNIHPKAFEIEVETQTELRELVQELKSSHINEQQVALFKRAQNIQALDQRRNHLMQKIQKHFSQITAN
jgi:hypothetical protein